MKTYKNLVLMLSCMLLTQFTFGQIRLVKFEHLDSLQKEAKKPVLVFLHTSWCKYCAAMKNTTFKNRKVQEILNEKVYFVSLDIEERSPIHFRGHTYKYKPTGTTTGVHELAEQLGSISGELTYPTTCFLNGDYDIVFQQGGFIQAKQLLEILDLTVDR